MNEGIKFIGNMRRLRLKPGDALVVKAKQQLSQEAAVRIGEFIEAKFPGFTVVVIDETLDIGVVGK